MNIYLIHTGEERDHLFLSSAWLLPLYISTSTFPQRARADRFHISLYLINSKKPVRGTETGLVVLSGAGQRSQGMSSRAEKSGSEMFMSHIGQSTTADLK